MTHTVWFKKNPKLRDIYTVYSGIVSDQGRKSAICEPFVHIWNHRLLPTSRLHSDPPHPPHLGGDFSPTSPTHAVKHECTVCFETSSKDLYPLLLSTIPSSVFLSMLSVTPTGLKWSISGVEGKLWIVAPWLHHWRPIQLVISLSGSLDCFGTGRTLRTLHI